MAKYIQGTPGSGEQIGLIINIEAQHNYDPGYKIIGNGSEKVTDYDLLTVILIRLGKEPKECGTEIIDFLTTLLNRFIPDKEKTTILRDKWRGCLAEKARQPL